MHGCGLLFSSLPSFAQARAEQTRTKPSPGLILLFATEMLHFGSFRLTPPEPPGSLCASEYFSWFLHTAGKRALE